MQLTKRRQILQMLNYGLLLGAVTWVLLIMRGAQVLKTGAEQTAYNVVFGPLTLLHMDKQAVGDGFTVRFAFELGTVWYAVFWLVIGSLLGILLVIYTRRARQP